MKAKIRIAKICDIYAPPFKVKKYNFSGMNIFFFCWILLLSTFKWHRDGSLKKQLCLNWSIFSVYTWIDVLIQAVSFRRAIPLRSHFNALSYSSFSPTAFFRPRLMYRRYHTQRFSKHRLRCVWLKQNFFSCSFTIYICGPNIGLFLITVTCSSL